MANLIVVKNVLGSLGTNCYTVVNTDTREAVIVDPAANAAFLLQMIKNQNYKPVAFLLTHAHYDHIGAVNELKEAYPDAPVVIGENDDELLGNCAANLSMMFGDEPVFVKSDKTVSDGEELRLLGTKIKCIEVPGHTKGGICYYIEENGFLFDGDTLFAGSIGRSDFPTGNGELLLSSIEEKLFTLPDETRVYPGHNNTTTIGREKTTNMFFA
ncbi:MAG: MBL fold metallo-hydrolase [Eubacterium sp.]|nr:MBL fold metallo-hydrolase [Eubacterium sp.]